ncbi:Phosphomannomutase [Neolecta irregularis DAH-3]|uniref:Phosphomannomutase n=1 Tax=Neolecta irregularis (strain DAH-3) TaxID=1198029 RepID=A0A1U7LMQ4_NEOID|nr:Phosphomannomutase [Neolecta irregularis DAH-3]|eukprot:OLL23934.1 Phosphomannomutase [Neolecta irregularis DAH-3]
MLKLLHELRQHVAIGFVGGSDLAKQQEQLATKEVNVVDIFDYAFAENGLTAYKLGKELSSQGCSCCLKSFDVAVFHSMDRGRKV